jgi:hypothetical protein
LLERGDMEAQAAQAEAAAAAKEASKAQAMQSAADAAAVILDDDEEGEVMEGTASKDTPIKVSRCVLEVFTGHGAWPLEVVHLLRGPFHFVLLAASAERLRADFAIR